MGTVRNWAGVESEIDIPDVRARIVLVPHQDGIPKDSSSIASGDGVDDWIHPSWSSPSSQMAIDGLWTCIISGAVMHGASGSREVELCVFHDV